MHPLLNIAIKAARNAGKIITRFVDRVDSLKIDTKSPNDFVSEVDRLAEREIIQVIRKSYPNHGILAEESGAKEGNDTVWIIDPLDGTTNFLHGFPHFAVSIAVQHQNRLEQAVVYDPMRDELFSASRGAGAQLNGRRIRVSKSTGLQSALIGTGFPFKDLTHLPAYLEMFKEVSRDTSGIRRAGSAALDLAYVAAGRLDGFWEIGLQPWDMAAGIVLIEEAGGLVSDFTGEQHCLRSGHVIGGSPKTFKALFKAVVAHTTPELKA